MTKRESKGLELFEGANELWKKIDKGEITQKELAIKIKPVRQLLNANKRLRRHLVKISELQELFKKGKITKENFDLEREYNYQEFKKTEREARQLAKIIKANAARK